MRRAFVAIGFACIAVLPAQAGAAACAARGQPIHWRADYCMLAMETDDEIAVSRCIEREGRRRFANACVSNVHFKKRMCALMIKNGTRSGSVAQCVKDPAVRGRTVRRGGVGG